MNGILISSSNNACHHSAFVETEMTTDLDANATWAETQGYQYQADKSNEKSVNEWNEEMINNGEKEEKQAETCWGAAHRFF